MQKTWPHTLTPQVNWYEDWVREGGASEGGATREGGASEGGASEGGGDEDETGVVVGAKGTDCTFTEGRGAEGEGL